MAKSAKRSQTVESVESAPQKASVKKGAQKKTAPKKAVVKKTPTKKIAAIMNLPVSSTVDAFILDRLYATVASRQGTDPALSHSARLLSRGKRKVAQKFGEEAVECLIEAVAGNKRELVGESADVLYHLIVMWVDAGVSPNEVWQELQRREGTSGIAEKASRSQVTVD